MYIILNRHQFGSHLIHKDEDGHELFFLKNIVNHR